MVRYFPHANPAFHPSYPHLLNFTPANVPLTMFGSSGGLGILLGLARYWGNWVCNQRRRGLCMRSAAVCAVIVAPLSALTLTMQARRTAPSGSLRRKKRVYFTNLRKIDVDDWYLGGALLGAALAAVPVRHPAVIGWKRYLGAACIGALGGRDVYVLKHHGEYGRAMQLQKEYEKQQSGEGGTRHPIYFPRESGK